MPYTIKDTGRPGKGRYEIVRRDTGRVVAHSASRAKAEAYTRMAHSRGEKCVQCGGKCGATPAMSAVDSTAGGSLIGPPRQGKRVGLKRNRPTLAPRRVRYRGKSLTPDDVFAFVASRGAELLDKDLHGGPALAGDGIAAPGVEFSDADMSITYPFAASQGRDRAGDFLEVGGIRTRFHRKNPVAYLDHGKWCRWPLGKDIDKSGNYTVTIDEETGLAVCTTFCSQSLPEAAQAYALYREGILKCGSIGYRPLVAKVLPADPENGFPRGLHLIEVELIETTLTGLPVNGDCARKALLDGVVGVTGTREQLAPALKSMLACYADAGKVWSNGGTVGDAIVKHKRKALENGDPAAAPGVTPPPEETPPPGAEEGAKIPHGAQTLADIYQALEFACEVVERESEMLDNDGVKKYVAKLVPALEKVKSELNAAFTKEYPDLEPLAEDDGADEVAAEEGEEGKAEEGEEEKERAEETKSLLHRTVKRRSGPGLAKGKALGEDERKVVGEAAEFLEGHKSEENLTDEQREDVAHHAEQLKALASGESREGEEEMTEEEKALVLSVLGRLENKLAATEKRLTKSLPA